jgi:putative transposase
VRYACIARHRGAYPVRLMCRVLQVAPAGFYAAQRRAPSGRARTDAVLRVHVRALHAQSDGTYGAPRIQRGLRPLLAGQGLTCGRHRAARLLRAEGLAGVATRRFRVSTTVADGTQPHAPNTLARQFAVGTAATALDRRWAADVTYLPTHAGWLYLAVVLDLASRRVVGWAMGPSLAQELPLAALAMARATRRPRAGTLHHSDRGRQYSSAGYRAALAAAGLTASMSRPGDCWDNAVVESFFATLKTELIHRQGWATRAAVQHAVFRYIEGWYNPHRLHSALDYRSPAQFEATLLTPSHVA